MSYNRRNQFDRIIAIQEITIEHTNKGVSQEFIYENLIRPVYYISKRTYYNYLSINAKRGIKELKHQFA